ncbi:MAG: hypothetical protein ABI775_07600, partial [Pseudonocardiales bacterium]
MRKNVPATAKDLALPRAKRRWSGVEQMTVRGWSGSKAGPGRRRPVAGRRVTRSEAGPVAVRPVGSL